MEQLYNLVMFVTEDRKTGKWCRSHVFVYASATLSRDRLELQTRATKSRDKIACVTSSYKLSRQKLLPNDTIRIRCDICVRLKTGC